MDYLNLRCDRDGRESSELEKWAEKGREIGRESEIGREKEGQRERAWGWYFDAGYPAALREEAT